ncbi:MAG TPA: hypothetical protein VH391_05030 [Solirubrobacterales bacterium]
MNLSRVTWLVLGTTMVLVSAVIVAAVFFINGTSERFPRGAATGGSGVAHLGSARVRPPNRGQGVSRLTALTGPGRRQVAAHPAVTGLAASLGPTGPGTPGPPDSGGPPGQQYNTSLQQLNAKLGR